MKTIGELGSAGSVDWRPKRHEAWTKEDGMKFPSQSFLK